MPARKKHRRSSREGSLESIVISQEWGADNCRVLIHHFQVNFIGMPTVKFTYALRRFFSGLKETPANAATLTEVLNEMETRYPGIKSYIVDEQGSLRKHVNIFIDGQLIS